MRALLIGTEPPCPLGCTYTREAPYEGVVIGSLDLSQLLHFRQEQVLEALAEGKCVILYTPGLPQVSKNRALAAAAASARRELQSWGVVFTDGAQKQLVTAKDARALVSAGKKPAVGAVLTPLAREILEGKA